MNASQNKSFVQKKWGGHYIKKNNTITFLQNKSFLQLFLGKFYE